MLAHAPCDMLTALVASHANDAGPGKSRFDASYFNPRSVLIQVEAVAKTSNRFSLRPPSAQPLSPMSPAGPSTRSSTPPEHAQTRLADYTDVCRAENSIQPYHDLSAAPAQKALPAAPVLPAANTNTPSSPRAPPPLPATDTASISVPRVPRVPSSSSSSSSSSQIQIHSSQCTASATAMLDYRSQAVQAACPADEAMAGAANAAAAGKEEEQEEEEEAPMESQEELLQLPQRWSSHKSMTPAHHGAAQLRIKGRHRACPAPPAPCQCPCPLLPPSPRAPSQHAGVAS
jgi:hypothetical protein